ncbi:MAG: hypothetical protein ABSF65_01975 [Candidatus Bathyarchaeia archaeon]
MDNKTITGIGIGLIVGLVLGFFIAVLFISPSGIIPIKAGVGTNNQVEVSGTVTLNNGNSQGIIYFANLNGTFETSTSVANGQYSVLLLGGQSYHIYDYNPHADQLPYTSYNAFYLPSGISTFTENLTPYS